QFHQLLKLDARFRFLGAYFLGTPLETGFVLLKRDPDNQIAADNLTPKGGLARALLVLLCSPRNHRCQDCQADDRSEFRSWSRKWPHGPALARRLYNFHETVPCRV